MFNFFKLFKGMPSISVQELQETMNKNVILLDVRSGSEFRGGHIPGAKNVPLTVISNYTKNRNQPIHVICQSGMRSKQAAQILSKKGYDVINVRGGMSQWRGPVIKGK